jgi:hypothetical protein
MCLKCKEEVTNPLAQVSLINDDYGIAFELFLLAINIKKEVCDVLESLFSFKRRYEKKKNPITCYF